MTDWATARSVEGTAADTWAWDQYWRDGRLASCGGEQGDNYQAVIADGWVEFFARVPPDSRIVDVCCGNGAIARLAARVALLRGVRFSIDAFDSAVIMPEGSAAAANAIRFRGRTVAESTPYPSEHFDCVAGQYAIEYTDIERSLPELARISQNGCRVRFMAHARGGVVVSGAHEQLKDIERLRFSIGIFTAARVLAQTWSDSRASSERRAAIERYRAAQLALEQSTAHAVEPEMYRNVGNVLDHALRHQSQVGLAAVLDKIDEVAAGIEAHAVRLSEMARAALGEEEAKALAGRAQDAWRQSFRVAPVTRSDDVLLGWAVESLES